jgi:hypothetical protein
MRLKRNETGLKSVKKEAKKLEIILIIFLDSI